MAIRHTRQRPRLRKLTLHLAGAIAGLLCAQAQATTLCPAPIGPQGDPRTYVKLASPDSYIGSQLIATTPANCISLGVPTGTSLTLQSGGSMGDVLLQGPPTPPGTALLAGGLLHIEAGGNVYGMAAAGERYPALGAPASGTGIYGVSGTIIVDPGATLAGALVGPTSTLTVGSATASATPAVVGQITTSGTVLVQNAKVDSSIAVDAGPPATSTVIAVVLLNGGNTTIKNSQVLGIAGSSTSAVVNNTPLTPAATDPITLTASNSSFQADGGINLLQNSPGSHHPITVNLTDSNVTAAVAPALDLETFQTTQTATSTLAANVVGGTLQGTSGLTVSSGGLSVMLNTDHTNFVGTSINGANVKGNAQVLFDNHTNLTGAVDGLLVNMAPVNGPQITLQNGGAIAGRGGAAVHVSGTGTTVADANAANIQVLSGSTLTGSNGNIIEVDQAGAAKMVTDGVALSGNTLVTGANSRLQLAQQNGSSITGDMGAAAGGSLTASLLGATSTGNVTADGAGSAATLTLGSNATVTGNLAATNSGQVTLQANQPSSRLAGGVSADNAAATVNLAGGAQASDGLQLHNNATGTAVVDGAGTLLARADGPALLSDSGSSATLTVGNGAQLSGQNGLLAGATNGGNATVNVTNTMLAGDMLQDAGSALNVNLTGNAALTGNLATASLSIQDSTWTMGAQASQSVGALSMNNGNIVFNSGAGPFKTLNASSLQGAGLFTMGVDFKPAGGNDLLNVSGAVTGAHTLDAYGEDQSVENPRNNIPLVMTGGGAGTFGLKGQQVDAGVYTYHLEQQGNQWVLVRNGDEAPPPPEGGNPPAGSNPPSEPDNPPPDTLSPAAKTALSMASAIPDVFYNEIGTLRLRQGDLRANRAGDGLWARSFTSLDKYNTTAAPAFDMNQYGIVVGADKRLVLKSGDLYVGALGSYSYSEVKIGGGSTGRINSYGLGAYATWLMENGWYLNGILKANSFDNDLRVIGSDGRGARGHYNMPGVGATLELGKHIELGKDGFMEPYTQLSGFTANSSSDDLDSGFDIHNGSTKSMRGEIGLLGGQTFPIKNGFIQPYMKGAFIHEFVDGNHTVLNGQSFTNDLSGTRMLAGVGVAAQIRNNLQMHVDASYLTGGAINQSVDVTVGVRYVW